MSDCESTCECLALHKEDFESDQVVKSCPGCGDHAVLSSVQKFLAEKGLPPEKYVFVSGIGCSSRFPYYMNTYGFHSIHGRAPAIATGIKLANPDLQVWVATGDGDALSIGGNHLLHALRRNLDMKILLFDNRIYGLTKGQYSPTSRQGAVTKSSPDGSPDNPLNPIAFALGMGGTFVARCLDVDAPHFLEILREADKHKGTSFVQIYQNCVIFNDGAFSYVRDKGARENAMLWLTHGKPMVYGKNNSLGLKLSATGATVVEFDPSKPDAALAAGVTVFDVHNPNIGLILTRLPSPPDFPVAMGVIYKAEASVLSDTLEQQHQDAMRAKPLADTPKKILNDLFLAGDTWQV